MASNYEEISDENKRRYGEDIGRYGPMLLTDRYDDRTHFIFELLQNAEDALRRRPDWQGQRSVSFMLAPNRLDLSHFGKPFDADDVQGVCGIGQSTKDERSIGRFGIGFKSVYSFTNRPQIHSGTEDFAIENYVWPLPVEAIDRHLDETRIVLPLKLDDPTALDEITSGFKRLGPGSLLFLRQIEEINWTVQGGASGVYLRSKPEVLDKIAAIVTVIGQETGKKDVDENWLVFHRDVFVEDQKAFGRVEIAFAVVADKEKPGGWAIRPVASSPLVVFFPTVVSTNLGFLVQGPYRTTPSRDNIPRADAWNQHLIKETAALVVDSMRWMRDREMLTAAAMRCLPLDRKAFLGSAFAPIFDAVKRAFQEERLIPQFGGGYVSASQAKLGRTQELRSLFRPDQIAALFGTNGAAWVTSEITLDRETEIRNYLVQELGITEVTPTTLVPRLTRPFLEPQPDEWILRFYEFLSGQEAVLRRHLDVVPLARLEDGTHVVIRENGKPNAFLPSSIKTSFPTIRKAVCSTTDARKFLIALGISEPNPVDDVIWNVLPRYKKNAVADQNTYAADIDRIRAAFDTDSKAQRERLLDELRKSLFVKVRDAGDQKAYFATPNITYLATERLKQLFSGIHQVNIVDDTVECLRGEAMRELFEACGALRYPRVVENSSALTSNERLELRKKTGYAETSGINDRVVDYVLQELDGLLALLPTLDKEQKSERARLIWESLGDLEERRGRGIFEGSYSWSHYGDRRCPSFPAAFIRQLNRAAWVPNADGELVPPGLVLFDSLGWKSNPFLLAKIAFKPPIIDQLAKEAGIDPDTLDLLRKLGITSVSDLKSMLRLPEQPEETGKASEAIDIEKEPGDKAVNVYGNATDLYGEDMPDIPPGTYDPEDGDIPGGGGGTNRGGIRTGNGVHGGNRGGTGGDAPSASHRGGSHEGDVGVPGGHGRAGKPPSSESTRQFFSYVAVSADQDESDPDGLDRSVRMQIEAQAIKAIRALEPALQPTEEGNPGFDLYQTDAKGEENRWVEVKSMTGSLRNRPATLSSYQFDFARSHGDAFWLYIVEYATDHEKLRILKIQNPAGHARTFTFDHGWSHIAQVWEAKH